MVNSKKKIATEILYFWKRTTFLSLNTTIISIKYKLFKC